MEKLKLKLKYKWYKQLLRRYCKVRNNTNDYYNTSVCDELLNNGHITQFDNCVTVEYTESLSFIDIFYHTSVMYRLAIMLHILQNRLLDSQGEMIPSQMQNYLALDDMAGIQDTLRTSLENKYHKRNYKYTITLKLPWMSDITFSDEWAVHNQYEKI